MYICRAVFAYSNNKEHFFGVAFRGYPFFAVITKGGVEPPFSNKLLLQEHPATTQ